MTITLTTITAVILIFLSGVGIGAAITDKIITEEENNEEKITASTDAAKAIRGQDDVTGSSNVMDI